MCFSGVLFPKHAGNVIFLFSLFSGHWHFYHGFYFQQTIFRGEDQPFVMELLLIVPTFKSVMIHMWQRAGIFKEDGWWYWSFHYYLGTVNFPRTKTSEYLGMKSVL